MATSILGGSDEVYEFVCQPCERDNQYEEAVVYCVECTDFLCSTCFICHKKSRVSCDHKILDKASIKQHGIPNTPPPLPPKPTKPKTTTSQPKPSKPNPPPTTSKPSKPATQQGSFTQKCQNHNDEFTKLFCNDHDKLVCTVCLVKDHKQCKDVTYIPEVSADIKENAEFKSTFTELKRMHALLGFEHNRKLYNETRLVEFHKSALDGLIKFKEEMLQAIEEVYAAVEKDLNALKDEQLAAQDSWLDSYNGVQTDVDMLVRNVESNMNNDNNNQLFVDMKLAKAELDTLNEKSRRLSEENHVTQYKFEGNADIVDTMKAANGFGKIMKRTNPSNVSAELLHEMTVKSDDDTVDCKIDAALVLPDGDLVVADNKNRSVKIIDTRQNPVKTKIVLESEPYGMALVEDDQLVVTLPAVAKLQFLQLSDSGLTVERSVSTEGAGTGIVYHDKKLISVRNYADGPGVINVMTMNGNILKTIENDYFGRSMYTKPRCLALSADKSAVYVTEWEDNRVKLVNLNGEQISEFQQPGKKTPLGVATDQDGTVYISHGGSNAIYRLSPTCKQAQKLLGEDDGLLRFPFAMALDQHRDLLYVGFMSSQFRNKVSVFHLKYVLD